MTQWNIDTTHSSANFSVRHMMVTTVRGSFSKVSGAVNFDPENVAVSSVEANIEAASISTGVADRDNHLRSADFFDAANFPHLTFKSTKVEPTSPTTAKVTGDLTIRDVTRPVTLDVEFLGTLVSNYGDTRAGFSATTKINREDFGLTWNQVLEAGGVLVGRDISIELEVQGIKVVEPATASA